MTTQLHKAQAFAQLHQQGTFVIPNFWDLGSAKILQNLGFQALASTSAGFAQTLGKLDSAISLEEKLQHLTQVCAGTDIPVSADFEHGFADAPADAAANLLRAAQAGVVGASIEDWSRHKIYDFNQAVERIQACAEAKSDLDFPFTLTARAENLLRGINDFDDTVMRLVAYAEAGADVLYAPGLASIDQVQAVLDAVDKPINVLFAFMPDTNFATYEELGVRRISLGGALANYAIGATLNAANSILEEGDFTWAMSAAPGKTIKNLLN